LAGLHQISLLQPFRKYGQPYFWGVGRCSIQESLLGTRQFEVVSGEFLFPDGTYVVLPGNSLIKSRSFQDAWVEADKPFNVYLGLRQWNSNADNVTIAPSPDEMAAVNTRFATTAESENVNDLHSNGPPAKVSYLTHIVRIFWENEKEKMDNYSFIPIARLIRKGDEIALAEDFAPPSLTVGSADSLVKITKDIRDQVASRCKQLEEYKNPKEIKTMTLALFALNRQVPLLTHLCEANHIHPWWAYSILRQIVGELSTFSAQMNANGEGQDGAQNLLPFDQEKLGECFRSIHTLISTLLNDILAGPEYSTQLKHDGSFFTGPMPHEFFGRHHRYWLLAQTSASAEEVVRGVSRVGKLASAENLVALVARAIPGIPLIPYDGVPAGLPQRANTQYFQIDASNRFWPDIIKAESISLYWNEAPQDLKLEVIVLKD
jgi:type VI secretion system protein ImpJ